MSTHNLCFEQKYNKYHNFSFENCHFSSHKNRSMLHRTGGFTQITHFRCSTEGCCCSHPLYTLFTQTKVCQYNMTLQREQHHFDIFVGEIPSPAGWKRARFQNLSLVMRKPAFCICENKDADQLRSNREADQRLYFRYSNSTIPLLPKSEILSI